MPRRPHIWFPGVTYHIEAKGNRNSHLFYDEKDYLQYLSLIEQMKTTVDFDLHAYSLLPNHLHLLVETYSEDISVFMQRLQTRYAMYVNRRHRLSGHVFQRRYKAIPLYDETHFFKTSHFIHRTPVQNHLVQAVSQYRWCSAYTYMNAVSREDTKHPLLTMERTLRPFPFPKKTHFQHFINRPLHSL